jgi:cell wall-associated NlpC family hydrolase
MFGWILTGIMGAIIFSSSSDNDQSNDQNTQGDDETYSMNDDNGYQDADYNDNNGYNNGYQDADYNSNNGYQDANYNSNGTPRSKVVSLARSMIGTPYKFGAEYQRGTPLNEIKQLDCSEFAKHIFYQIKDDLGYTLKDGARFQVAQMESLGKQPVSRDYAMKTAGVLAFIQKSNGKVVHVGITTGNGKVIQAINPKLAETNLWHKFNLFYDPF